MRCALRSNSYSLIRHVLILFLVNVAVLTPLMAQLPGTDEERKPDFPGLDIQAVVGWDGRVEVNAPVPISFLMSNQSSEVLEGHLILRDPETEREINLGDVFVGPGSSRRFSSVLALSDWNNCVAIYTDGAQDFWTRPLPLMTGKDFSEDVNYVLFVDDGGRALQLPTSTASADPGSESTTVEKPEQSGHSEERFTPSLGSGRPVQAVTVKSWQVPQHPGPLTVAQAMLFSEIAKVEMLNDSQWDAVGRWVCLGGTVFVHEASKEVLERLRKAVPFSLQPAVLVDEHNVYRCGGGSVREYDGQLFSADDTQSIRKLLEAASRLSRYNVLKIPADLPRAYVGTSNANYTRLMVLAVFSVYLLFSGVVTLLIFRATRRRVVIYIVSVVAVACLAAALLGSYLRSSRGDLHWQSVILGGQGGAVQVAQIEVQSAGGRNTQVAVRGNQADLQLLTSRQAGRSNYYSRFVVYNGRPADGPVGYAPFSVQPDLLQEEPDAFRIGVPITPWGVRQNIATAYDPTLQGVQVELTFRSEGSPANTTNSNSGDSWAYVIPGQWTVSLTNRLPFDLSECQLLVTTSVPQVSSDMNSGAYGLSANTVQFSTGRGDLKIGDIAASATSTSSMSNLPIVVTMTRYWYSNQNTIEPEPAFPGASEIWLMARVYSSPLLSIDDEHSDFEEFGQLHYYMQKLNIEEVPQEWLDSHKQCMEQQLNATQQQLKVLETQKQNPQF